MRQLQREVAVLLALAATLAVGGLAAGQTGAAQVCQTSQCLALSALITSNMNLSADPCEDFNAFACGNYAANNLYDPASLTWSRSGEPLLMQNGLSSISEKLKRKVFELLLFMRPVAGEDPEVNTMNRLAGGLFRSCSTWLRMRKERTDPARNQRTHQIFFDGVLTHLLESVGSKKALNGWFERALAKMVRYGIWPAIEVGPTYSTMIGAARDNGTRVRLSYYIWDLTDSNITTYTEFFRTLSTAENVAFDNPDEFVRISRELKRNVTEYLTEEQKFKQWGICSAGRGFIKTGRTDFTIRELEALSKCADPGSPFSWTVFFNGVLDGSVDLDTPIDMRSFTNAMDMINVVTYFKKRSLTSTRDGKLSMHFSFLIFDWLLSFSSYFPERLAAQWEKNPIRRSQLPPMEGEDPISDCMWMTKTLLGPVVERMFQKAYHEETFDHVQTLINLIQNATIGSVRKATWITDSSRDAIVDKIMALKNEIGFDAVSAPKLKRFYASTIRAFSQGSFSTSYSNFGMLVSLAICARAGRQNNLLSRDAPTSVLSSSDALIVNAFSYTRKNRIVFPMGILSPFLYHKSYPDYMNLGGLGVVIGHEIGHGFDNLGHELNKLGVRGHFWDNTTEEGYLERMDCVMSRFGSYSLVPGRNWPHNSNSTVGNDISDLMGIRSAFGALKLLGQRGRLLRLPNLPDSLTPERLFFVQAAQAWCARAEPEALIDSFKYSRHSPPHIRIRGMMENSRDFAQVFQCRPGQAMNPSDKCEFW